MNSLKIQHRNRLKQLILNSFACLFLFSTSINSVLLAQSPDSINAISVSESSVADTAAGPSLNNVSKVKAAGDEELKKIKKEEQKALIIEIIGYVVLTLLVMGAAWYLAAWARKQEKKRDEEKAKRVEKALQNRPPGTSRARKR